MKTELKFKPGDTVMLKSGGPRMTIKKTGKYIYWKRPNLFWNK